MTTLPDAIRSAATGQGLTLEAFRKKAGLSNGRFYEILSGIPPKKIDAIQKLEAAGVEMPKPDAKPTARRKGGRSSKAA